MTNHYIHDTYGVLPTVITYYITNYKFQQALSPDLLKNLIKKNMLYIDYLNSIISYLKGVQKMHIFLKFKLRGLY